MQLPDVDMIQRNDITRYDTTRQFHVRQTAEVVNLVYQT